MIEENAGQPLLDIPRTFRMSKGRRIFVSLTSIPIAIFIIGIIIALIVKGPGKNILNLVLIMVIVVGNCVIFIPRFLKAFFSSVTIDIDRIRSTSIWKRRELLIADISGFEINRDADGIQLRSKNSDDPVVTVSVHLEQFDDISHWIRTNFRNLSTVQYESEISEILTSTRYGQDKKTRRENYEIALLRAKSMNIFAIGVSIWTFVYPEPYEFAIIASAILPILAIATIFFSKGLIHLDSHTWSAHPHVTRAFLMPVLALFFRAFIDFSILSTNTLWLPLILSVIIFNALLFFGVKEFRNDRKAIIPVSVFIIIFVYGFLIETNCLFDSHPPRTYTAKIVKKRIHYGVAPVWYRMIVSGWDMDKQTTEEHVSRELYTTLEEGDDVCVEVRPGFLGIPWYQLAQCKK
jgi:hypothetical protein